jgi:hypothetical protein
MFRLLIATTLTMAQPPTPPPQPSPSAPQTPVPVVSPNAIGLDITKSVRIEKAPHDVVAKSAPVAVPAQQKVLPGNVTWHASFAAACEASRKSGKPVLLFQMMGQLDDALC